MDLIKKLKELFVAGRKTESAIIANWNKAGQPVPPPHAVKQNVIKDIQQKYQYGFFIETGTYLGDMIEAQKRRFNKLISIELGEQLYLDAVNRFKDDEHINILKGDSGDILVDICAGLSESAIFWLDGHYSEGITALGKKQCPIFEELTAILSGKQFGHILLIDDARLFTGINDYPTMEELNNFICSARPKARIYTVCDIIHVFI